MGDATGPISTLPGARHKVPDGTMCDEHPDRPAIARIQGETDSFGCEMIDGCAECKAKWDAYRETPEDTSGPCDWCKKHAIDLRNKRDMDEGASGPVYRVCSACSTDYNKRMAEEYEDDDEDRNWRDNIRRTYSFR